MSEFTLLNKLAGARGSVQSKAATATLTADEIKGGPIVATDAIELTLPSAATCTGYVQIIGADAAATVVATGGFGLAGVDSDTLTLADGEFCMVWSDGTVWRALHNEPAG